MVVGTPADPQHQLSGIHSDPAGCIQTTMPLFRKIRERIRSGSAAPQVDKTALDAASPAGSNTGASANPNTGANAVDTTSGASAADRISDSTKVFAVRGFMRSGTNWANNLLNLHPQIACQGEFHFNQMRTGFDQWMARDWNVPSRIGSAAKAKHAMGQLIKQLMLDAAHASPELRTKKIQWLGDRSPTSLDEHSHGPVPTFLMKRDGRDVIVSWTFLALARRDKKRFEQMPGMLEKLRLVENDPDYFKSHPHELMNDEAWIIAATRNWASRMRRDYEYMAACPEHPVMQIGYEDLHRNTESVRAEMYRFLDLDPEQAAPLDSGRQKTSAGLDREDPTSVYRKGKVGEWRRYFDSRCLELFLNEAGPELERAGYDVNESSSIR